MEGIAIQVLGFIFSLSFLVILHELGHFIPAKLFKTKVEKFYLFFDPWFSLVKFKKGDTEYGVGWLPLGGYVKIAGMIDESMDKEAMKEEPKEWEFRAKPAWQRLIIMIGGVAVNTFLAWFIYSLLLFTYGEQYIANEDMKDGVYVLPHPLMDTIGLKTGDKLISVDGEDVKDIFSFQNSLKRAKEIEVNRGGETIHLKNPENAVSIMTANRKSQMMFFRIPFYVGEVLDSSEAKRLGLKQKDEIIKVNDTKITYYDQFSPTYKQYLNDTVNLSVVRNEDTLIFSAFVGDEGILGVRPGSLSINDLEKKGMYKITSLTYSFGACWGAGYRKALMVLNDYYEDFKMIINPSTGAYEALGGFKTMGSIFPKTWDWQAIWERTAFLSIILAFMNLLPIPALDGGHVMFLLYEIITRRKPNEKLMEYAQIAGMVLLIGLMLYANLNDTLFN